MKTVRAPLFSRSRGGEKVDKIAIRQVLVKAGVVFCSGRDAAFSPVRDMKAVIPPAKPKIRDAMGAAFIFMMPLVIPSSLLRQQLLGPAQLRPRRTPSLTDFQQQPVIFRGLALLACFSRCPCGAVEPIETVGIEL
jgi:hypothetical protein